MKKFFSKLRSKICEKTTAIAVKAATVIEDVKGDLATNTIGAIIVAVVIVGLLVVAVKAFFPGFFNSMFQSMSQKLNANW